MKMNLDDLRDPVAITVIVLLLMAASLLFMIFYYDDASGKKLSIPYSDEDKAYLQGCIDGFNEAHLRINSTDLLVVSQAPSLCEDMMKNKR